jgi:hypothetical protein
MVKSRKGMGFEAAASSAAKSAGVSKERGRAIIAAGARKASAKAKRANPNLLKVSGVKKGPPTKKARKR